MKNKFAVVSTLAVLLCAMGSVANAGVAARSPHASVALNYTTGITSVTVTAGAVYQVILSSGAQSDFLVLFDSATGQGLTLQNAGATLKTRVIVSSSTQNTIVTYDPPLYFFNGIQAALSSNIDQALIVFEQGRGENGQ